MKKFFTLIALFAIALGAKAEWVEDYKIDYSTLNDFPFYVMGYAPSIINGVMVDDPVPFRKYWREGDDGFADVADQCTEVTVNGSTFYVQELEENPWRQYMIASEVSMELDVTYTLKAVVKASEAVNMNLQFGNWGKLVETQVSLSASDDFQEVEWEVSGCTNAGKGFICVQPGTSTAKIEWKSLTVSHFQKETRPVVWQEWLTKDGEPVIVDGNPIPGFMGDAETPWGDMAETRFNDQENNFKICAWGKEKGRNMNENNGWDPFPCDIVELPEEEGGGHAFIVRAPLADTEGDASAWDNQFWIQSPKEWKSGTQLKIKFRYKASKDVTVATQCHKQNPSDYLIWHAIGDIAFTTEWQTFDGTMTIGDDMGGTWSIAFQLNQNDKEAIDFYFDDLSWQNMKLDEGLFIASSNTETGIEYDFDNATEFVYDEESQAYVATVGTSGQQDSWVNEVMISTVRGNDAAFKGATLKPSGAIVNDPDEWLNYTESSLAKLKLPAAGVWKVSVDTEQKQMNFVKLEGEEDRQPIEIIPNPTVVTVNAQERDDLSDTFDNDGNRTGREEEGGAGETWDNQFWIMANRTLDAGEVTRLQFKYKASKDANTTTQCHKDPGAYLHWAAIGDVTFSAEWQDFEATFTVPSEANGMQSIAFNMAEIKEACVYEIKDVVWILDDETESLINTEGADNFYVKEGAGTNPHVFGADDGVNAAKVNTGSTVTYNVAGQRVTEGYKGIVIKNGKKSLVK